jgi:ubiquinone/menaquinone biosynthesis C-methylase UbiE
MFSVEHLNRLRLAELEVVRRFLPPQARILEIGAGTGRQGMELRKFGYDVAMIEIESSDYLSNRLCEITNYNGRDIPFGDAAFDVVFSSNVLEHVPELSYLHREISRVLKRDGYAIHVVPTHFWRFWSIFTVLPAAVQRVHALRNQFLLKSFSKAEMQRVIGVVAMTGRHLAGAFIQRRHGERGNVLSELRLFHPSWWRKNFKSNGYLITHEQPIGLFYTGSMALGEKLRIEQRKRLASAFGSACELFVVVPAVR